LSEIKPLYLGQILKVLCTRFNAQGSKIIIIVVHVGAIKIICSNSEGIQEKKKDKMKLNLPPKLWFLEFHPVSPSLNVNVLFFKLKKKFTPCMIKLRVLVLCVSLLVSLLLEIIELLMIFLFEKKK
jgi:hypothetical protein